MYDTINNVGAIMFEDNLQRIKDELSSFGAELILLQNKWHYASGMYCGSFFFLILLLENYHLLTLTALCEKKVVESSKHYLKIQYEFKSLPYSKPLRNTMTHRALV